MTLSQFNGLSVRSATKVAQSVFGENFRCDRRRACFAVAYTDPNGRDLWIATAGEGASWVEAFAAARAATGLVSK